MERRSSFARGQKAAQSCRPELVKPGRGGKKRGAKSSALQAQAESRKGAFGTPNSFQAQAAARTSFKESNDSTQSECPHERREKFSNCINSRIVSSLLTPFGMKFWPRLATGHDSRSVKTLPGDPAACTADHSSSGSQRVVTTADMIFTTCRSVPKRKENLTPLAKFT